MSKQATSNRRVQPSRWDLRAEQSARELREEYTGANELPAYDVFAWDDDRDEIAERALWDAMDAADAAADADYWNHVDADEQYFSDDYYDAQLDSMYGQDQS